MRVNIPNTTRVNHIDKIENGLLPNLSAKGGNTRAAIEDQKNSNAPNNPI